MDQDFLYKHLLDLAKIAESRKLAKYSRFLNPAQAAFAHMAARSAGVELALYGGYDDAEYRMARFSEVPEETWPIAVLRAEWNVKYGDVGHRDLLGAVMGLGVTRDCIGDIVLLTGAAFVFVTEEAGKFLLANLAEAGRVKLKVYKASANDELPPPKGAMVRKTVHSMRLDAVVAAVYDLSRERAKQLIERGDVRLNHVETERADAKIEEMNIVSVRGFGRFKLQAIQGETKKRRISLHIFMYGS